MLDKCALILQNPDLRFRLQDKNDWDGLWSKKSGLENLAPSPSPSLQPPLWLSTTPASYSELDRTWQCRWGRATQNTCLSLVLGAFCLLPIIWSCAEALLPFQTQLQKENVPVNHGWHLSRHRIRNGNWLSHYCSDRFSADYCQECFLRLVKTSLKTGGLLCANDSSQTRRRVQSFQRPHLQSSIEKRCWHIQVHHFERRGNICYTVTFL